MATDWGGERVPRRGRVIKNREYISQRVYRRQGQVVLLNRPRPQDVGRLSAIVGKVTPAVAYELVRGLSRRRIAPSGVDGVRYSTAGRLRQAGFEVCNTPSLRNPDHVSISWPGSWDAHVCQKFAECFGPVVWHHGRGGRGR